MAPEWLQDGSADPRPPGLGWAPRSERLFAGARRVGVEASFDSGRRCTTVRRHVDRLPWRAASHRLQVHGSAQVDSDDRVVQPLVWISQKVCYHEATREGADENCSDAHTSDVKHGTACCCLARASSHEPGYLSLIRISEWTHHAGDYRKWISRSTRCTTWARGPSLAAQRGDVAAVTGPNGRIFAIGGSTQAGGGYRPTRTTFVLAPRSTRWYRSTPLPVWSLQGIAVLV